MKVLTEYKNRILILSSIIIFVSCSTPEERRKVNQEEPVSKSHVVTIQQMKFSPAEVFANKGDTIIWINRDIVDHNVTEEANKEWSSSTLPTGKSWNMIATKSSDYLCTIHPVMKGKLTVK